MLPAYIYHQDSTFLCQTHFSYEFMSHSLRVPILIVKYDRNRHILFESPICAARVVGSPKRHSIRQRTRFSLHSCLSRSDRTYMVIEIFTRVWTRIWHFLHCSAIHSRYFTCWSNGINAVFFCSRHALVSRHTVPVLPQCTLLMSSNQCESFSDLRAIV